jgi:hypothetical protein
MSKTITLKFEATCADCGATLPVGATARWYGRGRIYGIGCHEKPADAAKAPRRARRDLTAYERGDRTPGAIASHYDRRGVYSIDGERMGTLSCGHIDFPCCGCGS